MELTFLKELMLIHEAHQKSDVCHYWYFINYSSKFNQMSAIDAIIY